MAIQDMNDSAPSAQPAAGQPNQNAPASSGVWNFHQQNLLKTPVSAGVGGEYFTKMRTSLTEIFGDIAEGLDVKVIGLNRQNITTLKFSALVVACRLMDVNPNIVAFHTLILEATGEKLGSAMRVIDNQQVRVTRVTSDAYDDVLFKSAFNAVSEVYPNSHIFSADAMVVPAKITADKKETVENLARNAALACVSVISSQANTFGELNLSKMDRDCRFVIDVAFGNHQAYDIVGEPQRSSVLISYSSQKKTANSIMSQETVNVPDNVARICELSGFLNAIWAPTEPQSGYGFQAYGANPNVQRRTEKFAGEFVITSVRTDYATSPAAVLLALSSCLSLVDGDTWIQAFLPKPNAHHTGAASNKVDITDIGALNITANLGLEQDKGGFGQAIGLESFKNDLIEVNKYLVSIFRPGVIISMDCPEAGPSSWYMSVFSAAASGNQAAYNQIFEAANELTDNKFEQFFKHGQPMFTNITRVPLGHYALGDTLQDIRNIDYTAIANLFAKNPSAIHDYSNTFVDRPGVSSARNLSIREGIILHALNEQAEITGYAARVSIADGLITALSQAIAACGLPVTVNTPLNADQLRSGVAAPDFIQGSLARGTHTFSQGFGAPARQQNYRYDGFRR